MGTKGVAHLPALTLESLDPLGLIVAEGFERDGKEARQ
jgi:hypothetical protein